MPIRRPTYTGTNHSHKRGTSPQPQRALLRTAQEVAKGMAYIHENGVVHGYAKGEKRVGGSCGRVLFMSQTAKHTEKIGTPFPPHTNNNTGT